MSGSSQSHLFEGFNAQSAVSSSQKTPRTIPLSIRVTKEEKARIQNLAGNMAVGNFIRQRVLGDDEDVKRPKRHRKKQYKPKLEHVELARLLGMFGQSELAQGILALSLVAQSGELDVTPDVSSQISSACAEIQEMKNMLIVALGVMPQESG